jgi:DNA repair protein RecO (recombination protein O)
MATSESGGLISGWLLHRRPYRNSSLILDVFTANGSRLAAVARAGQRNPLLQPFRPLMFQLRGRTELRSLVAVESAGAPLGLQGERLYCGLYVNELLERLLHRDDPHAGLMEAYQTTLTLLVDGEVPADVLLRHFEMRLLDILGYGFSVELDLNGCPLEPVLRYRLLADQGLQRDVKGPYLGASLSDIAAGRWHDDARRVARDLMREALAPHLGGRPLVSRKLFRHAGKYTGKGDS